MRQYSAKRDRNDKAIRQAMEALGWAMFPFSARGWPDYYAVKRGRTAWVEVKGPNEPFTPEQMEHFARLHLAGVPVYVLTYEADATRLDCDALPAWTPEAVEKVWSAAGGRRKVREHRPGVDKARTVAEGCKEDFCTRSRAPSSAYCTPHGKADAVPPPRRSR